MYIDVGVMLTVSPNRLNDMQLHTVNYWRDLIAFFVVFSRSHLNVTKQKFQFPTSSPWFIQILVTSLNITIIQLSTRHDCFSLTDLTSFSLVHVFVFVWLFFKNINLMSLSGFLPDLSQIMTLVSTHLFCYSFSMCNAYF